MEVAQPSRWPLDFARVIAAREQMGEVAFGHVWRTDRIQPGEAIATAEEHSTACR